MGLSSGRGPHMLHGALRLGNVALHPARLASTACPASVFSGGGGGGGGTGRMEMGRPASGWVAGRRQAAQI